MRGRVTLVGTVRAGANGWQWCLTLTVAVKSDSGTHANSSLATHSDGDSDAVTGRLVKQRR